MNLLIAIAFFVLYSIIGDMLGHFFLVALILLFALNIARFTIRAMSQILREAKEIREQNRKP